MVEFLAQTGMRISEVLPLAKADLDFGRRRDLDFGRRRVQVVRRLYEGSLDAPKSRHGVRQISLSPS